MPPSSQILPFLPPSVCWLLGCIPHGPKMAAVIPGITSLYHKTKGQKEERERASLILMSPSKKEEKFLQSSTSQKTSQPFRWPEFYQMLIPDQWYGKWLGPAILNSGRE